MLSCFHRRWVRYNRIHRFESSLSLKKYTRKSQEATLAGRGFQIDVSLKTREYLAEVGYDPDFGARPLKRAIQRELQYPLALKILGGGFHEGETIYVDRGVEGLQFTVQGAEQSSNPK